MNARTPHIGLLREGPLHAALKEWYSEPGDCFEEQVGPYVIDLIRGDLLIEIQTAGFAGMRSKVEGMLGDGHRLRIVHPIPVDKWIVKIHDDGTIDRRMSPKHGQPAQVFAELVSFPALMSKPGLELELVMTREEEFRHLTPGRSWRRQGWGVLRRELVEVTETIRLSDTSSLGELLPQSLPDAFTTSDIATGLRCDKRLAQQTAYCLREVGQIVLTGKRGRSLEYRRASDP